MEGEKAEAVTDFLFLSSKITVNGDCGHEIRRPLLLGRKAMTNLDSILKSKDITLPTMVHTVKAMVLYGCESLTMRQSVKELVLSNCNAGETLESPLESKKFKPVNFEGN